VKEKLKQIFGITAVQTYLKKRADEKVAKEYQVPAQPLSPKEQATANKEPYIAVLETHIDKENPRNGFFELDWNEYFVLMLTKSGYRGTTEEEIVDQWFNDLCKTIGEEEGVDMERRGSGYINVSRINGKTEVS
jgi:hypothetical protein